MTKAELVDHVAATVHLSKSQTEAVLTQCLQAIMDALQAGESVELRGFGRFQLRHRPPRAGRNPRTGETIPIPAKAVPTFTAGKAFQERVHPSPAAAGGAREVHARCGGGAQTGACTPAPLSRAIEGIPGGDTGDPCGAATGAPACGGHSGVASRRRATPRRPTIGCPGSERRIPPAGEGKERGDGPVHGTA